MSLEEPKKVLMPIMRKVMPQILAQQIADVQPMAEPSGQVFSLNRISYRWTQLPSEDWQLARYQGDEITEVLETITPQERTKRMLKGTWYDVL